ATQGAKDGADAVAKATALGMKAGSPLYLDMEPVRPGQRPNPPPVIRRFPSREL
ncbi:glycoside hydrolase domain-containing protein, partial [Streptomyces sp. NPDC005408]|uniref:glycoside hydrolase domain-containing protein n=1 Tax=Streptomyces sp. NPDC005408 TaxID=3155341 RepID=UPI0033B1A6B0